MTHNKQLQRTVQAASRRAACASFHYAHAARFMRQCAAAHGPAGPDREDGAHNSSLNTDAAQARRGLALRYVPFADSAPLWQH